MKQPAALIGIVAGEMSGDIIAAGLIQQIRQRHPEIVFVGIGGERMIAAGCQSLFPLERLSVMAITEVLGRLKELLGIRKHIFNYFKQNRPLVFIGVDAPDFNLRLEFKLKQLGIPTIHYVSPSVWAWRSYRVKKIKKSIDLMLTLFPFEAAFYEKYQVPVKFVGHPQGDAFPIEVDEKQAKQALGIAENRRVLALLPGSRKSEVMRLGELLRDSALRLQQQHGDLSFVIPVANEYLQALVESIFKSTEQVKFQLVIGQSQTVMSAADVIIMASGTAALEAMLLKKPVVVTYKVSPLSYFLIKRLANVDQVALPNFLTPTPLVPEYLQDQATVENLVAATNRYLQQPEKVAELKHVFAQVHRDLRKNTNQQAAKAVMELINYD